jgi:hypothetical protein
MPILETLVIERRFVDCFDEAAAKLTVPAEIATVVISTAATLFFVDIEMSPVPCIVSKSFSDL